MITETVALLAADDGLVKETQIKFKGERPAHVDDNGRRYARISAKRYRDAGSVPKGRSKSPKK